jgi:hypothetical protein
MYKLNKGEISNQAAAEAISKMTLRMSLEFVPEPYTGFKKKYEQHIKEKEARDPVFKALNNPSRQSRQSRESRGSRKNR